jgi:hypothetical protein
VLLPPTVDARLNRAGIVGLIHLYHLSPTWPPTAVDTRTRVPETTAD